MPEDPTPKIQRFRDVNPELRTYRSVAPPDKEEALEQSWTKGPDTEPPPSRVSTIATLAVIVAAIVGGVIYVVTKQPEAPAPSLDLPPVVEHRSDKDRRELIEAVLDGFFAAETVEGRLGYIIQTEPVRQRMEQFYSEQQPGTVKREEIEEIRFVRLNRTPWAWVTLDGGSMGKHVVALKESGDYYRIDWESLVGYGEMSWPEFIEKRPSEPVQMRALIRESDYYNYKYDDPDKYACYRIDRAELAKPLYGFVERGSDTHRKLQDTLAPGTTNPASLKIFFEADAGTDDMVVIDDFLFVLWTDPELLDLESP